ncbi:MAG: membrane protein insertion efficiency factor YidD [Chlamydiota bacterium]
MLFKICLLLVFPLFLCGDLGFVDPWGKDSDLSPSEKPAEKKVTGPLVAIANTLLLFHQRVISPIDGPRSNFRPTSSRYMQLAIQRYGFFKGVVMGCDRLLRENNEKWIYPTITIDEVTYKYDPAFEEKSTR